MTESRSCNLRCSPPVQPHPKGTGKDRGLATAEAIWVQWSHFSMFRKNQCETFWPNCYHWTARARRWVFMHSRTAAETCCNTLRINCKKKKESGGGRECRLRGGIHVHAFWWHVILYLRRAKIYWITDQLCMCVVCKTVPKLFSSCTLSYFNSSNRLLLNWVINCWSIYKFQNFCYSASFIHQLDSLYNRSCITKFPLLRLTVAEQKKNNKFCLFLPKPAFETVHDDLNFCSKSTRHPKLTTGRHHGLHFTLVMHNGDQAVPTGGPAGTTNFFSSRVATGVLLSLATPSSIIFSTFSSSSRGKGTWCTRRWDPSDGRGTFWKAMWGFGFSCRNTGKRSEVFRTGHTAGGAFSMAVPCWAASRETADASVW